MEPKPSPDIPAWKIRHQRNLESKVNSQLSAMPTLEELSKKRASAKGQVTLLLRRLLPLLELRGTDAIRRSTEVSECKDKLCDKIKAFRETHEQYSELFISNAEEKELENTLETLDGYYNEVDSKYYDAIKKYDVFHTECEVISLKDDIEASIEDYTPVEKEVQIQFDKYQSKTVEELEGCAEIKHIAALELKNKLNEAFSKVTESSKKLRKAFPNH